jgi:CDP-glucose 4,6-dehydratase
VGVGQRPVEDVGVSPDFWRGKRVLVTGHTGFKGSWLTLWLLHMGAEVQGLGLGPPTDPSLHALARLGDEVPAHEVDIRDGQRVADAVAAANPEVLFHMAAQPLVRRSLRDPIETFAANVMGTAHVLEAGRHQDDLRVLVNVTSDKCYANREWEWGYRENEAMGGGDPYSASKGCAELVTAAYRKSFLGNGDGMRLASARAGNVIGGGDWAEDRLIPDLIRGAEAGTAVVVRFPQAVRPWQHVLNPLSGYLMLAEAAWADPAFADAFNFGPADEDAQPVGWLVERFLSRWPGELEVEFGDSTAPPEAGLLKLDSARARTRLGWRPAWAMDEGLDATIAWYAAHAEGADPRAVTLDQVSAFMAAGAGRGIA